MMTLVTELWKVKQPSTATTGTRQRISHFYIYSVNLRLEGYTVNSDATVYTGNSANAAAMDS
jgi:hypothetical protein